MSNFDICISFFDERIAYWEALEIRNSQFGVCVCVFLIFNFYQREETQERFELRMIGSILSNKRELPLNYKLVGLVISSEVEVHVEKKN